MFPQSTNETVSLPVRQLDFNYTNFGTFVGGGYTEQLGDPRIYNLAFRTASTGKTIELDSPGHYQNVSYHLDFNGPAVKCTSASKEFLYNLTYQYGVKYDTMIKYRFLSRTHTPLETSPEAEAIRFPGTSPEDTRLYSRVYVMTNEGAWNVTRTYKARILLFTDRSMLLNACCTTHLTALTTASNTPLRRNMLGCRTG